MFQKILKLNSKLSNIMDKPEKKEFILSRIDVKNKEIESYLSQLNKSDAIVTLLSLYEAHSYMIQDIKKKLPSIAPEFDEQTRAVFSDSRMHEVSLLHLIEYVLVNLDNRRSELDRIPIIDTLVFHTPDPENPFMMNKLESHYNFKKDKILFIDLSLLDGKHQAIRCYPIRDFFVMKGSEQVLLCFELMRAFHSKSLYETTIRNTDQINIDGEGKITFPNITIDDFLNQTGIHPRTFDEIPMFPHWNPKFAEHQKKIEKIYDLGLKSPKLQKMVKELMGMEFDEYKSIPNFKKNFKKHSSVELDKYIKIVIELFLLLYNTEEAQIKILKSKFISKLKRSTGCTPGEIKSIINEKTWDKVGSLIEKPLIFDGVHYHFTHGILQNSLGRTLRKCYEETINNNTKGKYFEKDCRQIFKNNSCYVLEDSVKINELFMPKEISEQMWGFQKDKTDIDVVGTKNDILFIIECKTRKSSLIIKDKVKDRLKNSFDETYYMGKWVAEHFEKFCIIAEKQGLSIPKNCKFVVPLFVSNILVTVIKNYNPISLKELSEILQKIKSPVIFPNFKITFDTKVEETFPVFEIKN